MREYTKKEIKDLIIGKLHRNFGREVSEATNIHMFKACALVLRDIMSNRQLETEAQVEQTGARQVHYLSLEFLMGRSLMKNAYNLNVLPALTGAIEDLGFSASDLFEAEPDAGLGNGGLGRLAACYLDSMTTLDIPATGYSICYELGIFKQKIVDGQQGWTWGTPGSSPKWMRPKRSVSAAPLKMSGAPMEVTPPSTKTTPPFSPSPGIWRSPATAPTM